MPVKKWTPIQEARFHFRSMGCNERLPAYVRRTYPHATAEAIRRHTIRIRKLLALAMKEAEQRAAGRSILAFCD